MGEVFAYAFVFGVAVALALAGFLAVMFALFGCVAFVCDRLSR